jgi:hypothetical protein
MISFKKIIVAAFIMALIIPNIMKAQKEVKKYNYSLSTSPISLAFDVWPLITYEQQIGKENTITAQIRYTTQPNWTGWGLGASYRWYFFQETEKAIKGIGFGPLVRVEYFSHKADKADISDETLTSIAIGFETSYKWIIDGGFIIEPILQIGFSVNNKTINPFTYPIFGIGINVGYAWK